MGAPKGNKYALGNRGGSRKSAAQEFLVRNDANKFQPLFWKKLNQWADCGDKELEKFAIGEFNKIQCKLIPQDVTSGGKPVDFNLALPDKKKIKEFLSLV